MKFYLKIKNETEYQTRHLRKFVFECAKRVFDPDRFRYTVKFVPAKKYITGYATVRGAFMLVRLPNPSRRIELPNRCIKDRLAFVIAHEIGHWRGMTHSQMKGNPCYDQDCANYLFNYAWAFALPLDMKQAAVGPTKSERAAAKLEHAKTKFRQAQTREKRAKTILRKWEKTVRRLEKKTA